MYSLATQRRPAWLRDESATEIQPTSTRLRFGEGPVVLFLAWSEKVHDPLTSGMQELSDQAPVAAPPECLRAHQANGRLRERRCQCLLPARRAHAGGVTAKRGDAETAEPLLAGLVRVAVAIGGGWFALRVAGGLDGVYGALALGLLVVGIVNAAAVASGAYLALGATGRTKLVASRGVHPHSRESLVSYGAGFGSELVEVPLADGDRIEMGEVVFRFRAR